MKRLFPLIVSSLILLAAGAASAQQKPVRTGTIAISTKSVGFILGAEWGSGTVTLTNGRSYNLRIRTLKVGMAGLESVSAQGAVYNLDPRRPQDIAGTYASMGAGITLGGGVGAQSMKNEKGVIIELQETQLGVAAKFAASGISVELVQ